MVSFFLEDGELNPDFLSSDSVACSPNLLQESDFWDELTSSGNGPDFPFGSNLPSHPPLPSPSSPSLELDPSGSPESPPTTLNPSTMNFSSPFTQSPQSPPQSPQVPLQQHNQIYHQTAGAPFVVKQETTDDEGRTLQQPPFANTRATPPVIGETSMKGFNSNQPYSPPPLSSPPPSMMMSPTPMMETGMSSGRPSQLVFGTTTTGCSGGGMGSPFSSSAPAVPQQHQQHPSSSSSSSHTKKEEKTVFHPGTAPNSEKMSRKTKRSMRVAAVKASRPELVLVDEESPEERARKKKERRMIRNRESALQSRLRKKKQLDDLEDKVSELEQANRELLIHNQQLLRENDSLRRSIRGYQQQPGQQQGGHPIKTVGVLTFVFLFSFGIFTFGLPGYRSSSSSVGMVTKPPVYTGRVLQSLDSSTASSRELVLHDERRNLPSSSHEPSSQYSLPLLSYEESSENFNQKSKDISSSSPSGKSSGGSSSGRSDHRHRPESRTSFRHKLLKGNQSEEILIGGAVSDGEPSMEFLNGTSYFYVTQGQRFIPPENDPKKPKEPKESLSVIIPSQLFNVSEILDLELEEGEALPMGDYFVVLSLKISGMAIYPFESSSSVISFPAITPTAEVI